MQIDFAQRDYLVARCRQSISETVEWLNCIDNDEQEHEACDRIEEVSSILNLLGWNRGATAAQGVDERTCYGELTAEHPVMPLARLQAIVGRFIREDQANVDAIQRELEVLGLEREGGPAGLARRETISKLALADALRKVATGETILLGQEGLAGQLAKPA